MYAIGLAALVLTVFAIACGEPERATPPTAAPEPPNEKPLSASWTCEELLLEILEINEEAVAKDSREEEILKVYGFEETKRSEDRLDCNGLARTSQRERQEAS